MTAAKVEHLERVSDLGEDRIPRDFNSPTGYERGVRRLIIPGHNEASYRWIAQTEQMFVRHEWHVRRVDYDNPPLGHEVSTPSVYRWWLGLLAWLVAHLSGLPLGIGIEKAAVFSDPLLLCILVSGVALLWAREVGVLTAALVAAALLTFFPWAGDFVPGRPDAGAFALISMFSSILFLLPGIVEKSPGSSEVKARKRSQRWFFVSGCLSGFALWLNVRAEVPLAIGLMIGGILAEWQHSRSVRGSLPDTSLIFSWRAWTLGGGAMSLTAYLTEYYPDQFGLWRLQSIHPLYGLAWIGGGELLHWLSCWFRHGRVMLKLRPLLLGVGALGLVFALPLVIWSLHQDGLILRDGSSLQLSKSLGGMAAENSGRWLYHQGFTPLTGLVLLPILIVLPAYRIFAQIPSASIRARLAVAVGPVAIALLYACWQMSWWRVVDATLIVLLVPVTEGLKSLSRPGPLRAWVMSLVVLFIFESIPLLPIYEASKNSPSVDQLEAKELIERDLAHWLNLQGGANRPVVFAPANETSSLCYYGGIQGLATLDPDNQQGLIGAVRIASATSAEEARELISNRGITHIIIPSWDSQLDDDAIIGLGQLQGSFIDQLHHWNLPAWLRPLGYQLPTLTGQQAQSVTILATIDDQDDPVRLSRLAEYYIEMNRLDLIASVEEELRRYPGDSGALVALTNAELARGDEPSSTRTFNSLLTRLSAKNPKSMIWDRRLALSILLARFKRFDLSREQARRCFADATDAKLRTLSSASLYHLLVLGKAYTLTFDDPKLRLLALELLPVESRLHIAD